ncbi:MAG: flavin reductase family protein [Rubripirellula sp.]
MQFDPDKLSVRELYGWMVRLITPRPIAWVSTQSAAGVCNLAPYSFFNGVGANPPTIMFCPANNRFGEPKDTLANIRHTGEFVINVVTETWGSKMNATSAEYDSDIDEFNAVGVPKIASTRVTPPRVENCKAAFECELHQAIALGHGPGAANLVIGRIVSMHVADNLIGDGGEFLADDFDTIGRLGGDAYTRTIDRFELPRPRRPKTGDGD